MRWKHQFLRFVAVTTVAFSKAVSAQESQPAAPPAEQPAAPSAAVSGPDESPHASAPAAVNPTAGSPSGGARRGATEEIVVTGSRVHRKDLTTPAPVTVISRAQIQNSAVASVGDFLQMMPEQGNATNTQVNNGGNGTTQISLRSLGSNRTLVLVDGKRYVYGGNGADTSVDLSSIASAAIERVEVLKDGASAIYGSDAIAGVVNIITRRKLNGTEATAYYGLSQHNDANVVDLNVTGGATGEKGGFLLGAGFYDQYSFFASNRDWANHAITYDFTAGTETPGGSSNAPPGVVFGLDTSAAGGCTTPACVDLATRYPKKKQFIYDPSAPSASKLRPFTGSDKYNFQAVNFLVTPSQRISLFSNGEYHLADNARAYIQGSLVNRQGQNQLAAEPLNTNTLGIVLSGTNAYNPLSVPGPNGTFTGPDIAVGKRLLSSSARTSGFDSDTLRTVLGIDGTLPDAFGPAKGFFYDTSFNYGRTLATTITHGSINAIKTANALGPSFTDGSGLHCGLAATGAIPGCAPANVFGVGNPAGDQLAGLGATTHVNHGSNQEVQAQANLSGELFKLFSDHAVGIGVGYEYRQEYGVFTPDQAAVDTFVNPNGFLSFVDSDFGTAPTSGSYYVNEGYAELDAPLVNHLPGIDDLEVQAAVRVFNYSTFGRDNTYKIGGRYRPIRDITFRATYSTAFRAPNVLELYQGQAPVAETAVDPCAANSDAKGNPLPPSANKPDQIKACGLALNNPDPNNAGAGQINSVVGGNLKLLPEKARTLTAGVVVEPQAIRGLSLTADFWHVNVQNTVQAVGSQSLLNACYGIGGPVQNKYCSGVHRDPTTQIIFLIDDPTTNIGDLTTDGIDLAFRYSTPSDFGRFGFLVDATYLLKFDQNIFQLIHGRSNYDLGLNPNLKFNAGLNYGIAGFGANALLHFIGGFTECANGNGDNTGGGQCYANNDGTGKQLFPNHAVPNYISVDLAASYAFKDPLGSTTLGIGVRNVGNTVPPRVYDTLLTYTDPSGYDFIGRYVYGRLSHTF